MQHRKKGFGLNGQGKDTRLQGRSLVIVVEARIESRLWTLDTRASIFKLHASIRESSPLNNILFKVTLTQTIFCRDKDV
jgi:hypothetical protein